MKTSIRSIQDPMDAYKEASDVTGRHTPKSNSQSDLTTGMGSDTAPPLTDQQGRGGPTPMRAGTPPGTSGFMGMLSGVGAAAHHGSPDKAAEMLSMQQSPTAEKMARGILAVGSMMAASINKTSTALGGALTNYAANAMNRSPPLSEPFTVSQAYVSRLSLVQMCTQPLAQGAQVVSHYAGELFYYFLQIVWAIYRQLAAMKVLPQLTAGAASDEAGVPINPVRGGLPMGANELETFKLVAAALLMAYVEVYDATEEAAQLLFRQASSAGERYLAHRHGGEAADVASAALSILADLMNLTINWLRLLGRGLVSKAATNTARGYLLEKIPDLKLD